MDNLLLALAAGLFISCISFVGIWLLLGKISAHGRLVHALIAFAAGALLGDALLHLLHESIDSVGYSQLSGMLLCAGIVAMFVIETVLRRWQVGHNHQHEGQEERSAAWLNNIGDALHNLLDGIALASAFTLGIPVGIATTIAIIIHEVPQEIADAAIMIHAGWSRKKVLTINFLIALTAIFGILATAWLNNMIVGLVDYLPVFVAGQFLYISLASLVPTVQKWQQTKIHFVELIMFVAGIGVMFALTFWES